MQALLLLIYLALAHILLNPANVPYNKVYFYCQLTRSLYVLSYIKQFDVQILFTASASGHYFVLTD